MGAEHQKKKELNATFAFTKLRIPFRKRNQLYRSHFRVFLLDASVYYMFFLFFLASDFNHFEVLTHRRHSEAILGQRRAQHIPTRARKHLTKKLPCRHLTKSEPIKIADFQDLLMLSHHNSIPFCSVSGALPQLDVDRMPRHIHRNGILLSHPTCTQSFNLTGVSHFR